MISIFRLILLTHFMSIKIVLCTASPSKDFSNLGMELWTLARSPDLDADRLFRFMSKSPEATEATLSSDLLKVHSLIPKVMELAFFKNHLDVFKRVVQHSKLFDILALHDFYGLIGLIVYEKSFIVPEILGIPGKYWMPFIKHSIISADGYLVAQLLSKNPTIVELYVLPRVDDIVNVFLKNPKELETTYSFIKQAESSRALQIVTGKVYGRHWFKLRTGKYWLSFGMWMTL